MPYVANVNEKTIIDIVGYSIVAMAHPYRARRNRTLRDAPNRAYQPFTARSGSAETQHYPSNIRLCHAVPHVERPQSAHQSAR